MIKRPRIGYAGKLLLFFVYCFVALEIVKALDHCFTPF